MITVLRSTKGLSHKIEIDYASFIASLYNPNLNSEKSFMALQFSRLAGSICMVEKRKKAISSIYTKLKTHENLVQCTIHETF